MVLVVAIVSLATAYIVTHVGPAPSYAGLASRFDGAGALTELQVLAAPELEGRQPGSPGAEQVAAYIAQRFSEYGLETLKHGLDYRLPWTTQVVAPVTQPILSLHDASGQMVRSYSYREDFGVDISGHGGSGEVNAPVVVLVFPRRSYTVQDFQGLDLRGRIAMYVAENAPSGFEVEALIRGALGIAIIDEDITPRLQLAHPGADYLRPVVLPIFRLHPNAADALLALEGLSVSELRREASEPEADAPAWQMHELNHGLHMRLELSSVQQVTTENVLGVLRGADAVLNDQLVVVAAHYDGPGLQPDGTVFQSANSGASGVAVMLEILRLWTTTGFQPRRTVYFVAWSGGEWEHSGAHQYLEAQAPYSILETVAVFNLDRLGGGGDELLVSGDRDLVGLLLRTAGGSGVPAREGAARQYRYQSAFRAPSLTVGWSENGLRSSKDTIHNVVVDKLAAAGQAVNLALITVGREYDY
jgi:hypothetical protein